MLQSCLQPRVKRYLISAWTVRNFGKALCINSPRKSWKNGFLILSNYPFKTFIRIQAKRIRFTTLRYIGNVSGTIENLFIANNKPVACVNMCTFNLGIKILCNFFCPRNDCCYFENGKPISFVSN